MTLAQGFVLLSDQDSDGLGPPAVCTVSKDDAWDHGGFALGASAAAAGMTWADRPYFTGNPEVGWLVERLDRATAAGGLAQIGNEQNLELEQWVGGPEAWFAFEQAVRAAAASPDRLLAMPPSPGLPGWEAWVRDVGDHAVHAYGSCDQMRAVVQWYLEHTSLDLYITECNFGAGNAVDVDVWAEQELRPFLDWCASEQRIKLCAYFAWIWHGAPEMPTSVDARGTVVEQLVRDWLAPMNGGANPLPPAFSIDAVRDQLWTIANQLEENGWDWLGQNVKAAVALSKGER